jgi:uncharacterized membrane protein
MAGVGGIAALALATSAIRPMCTEVTGSDRVSVPLAELLPGSASFFCHRDDGGKRLRFILARDNQGKVHAILDACQQCGKFHEGYRASNGELICRVCGNHYKLADVERGEASCVPIRLSSQQVHDRIEVRVSDLKQVSTLF